jgi:hypothetical protein
MKKFLFTYDIKRSLHVIFSTAYLLAIPVAIFIIFVPNWYIDRIGQLSMALILVFNMLKFASKIIKGQLLTIDWFREQGIHIEAFFVEVKRQYNSTTTNGMTTGVWYTYTIVVRGVNPLTRKVQTFKQSCEANAQRFKPGDRLVVYLHPKRPRSAYRIDL